jgi:hypothetical protein
MQKINFTSLIIVIFLNFSCSQHLLKRHYFKGYTLIPSKSNYRKENISFNTTLNKKIINYSSNDQNIINKNKKLNKTNVSVKNKIKNKWFIAYKQ